MWPAERIWRLVATGVLYMVFGAGSILIGLFVMLPLALLLFAAPRTRVRLWRRVIRLAFAGFVGLAEWLGVLRVHFSNPEALLEPGQLIVANHPSLLDVVILISRMPDVDCVIKHRLSKNPFVALQVWLADYVRNDAAEQMIGECAGRLDAGRSLIVFPEGTRTRRNEPVKFLRGTAHTLLACSAPLRPVLIHCHPLTLGKCDPWYRVPETKIVFHILVRPCLSIEEFRQARRPPPVRARQLSTWLEQWFIRELHRTSPATAGKPE